MRSQCQFLSALVLTYYLSGSVAFGQSGENGVAVAPRTEVAPAARNLIADNGDYLVRSPNVQDLFRTDESTLTITYNLNRTGSRQVYVVSQVVQVSDLQS